MLLHYLEKSDQVKYVIKWTESLKKTTTLPIVLNTCWNEWKTSINSIYPNLPVLTAGLLQGFTVMQQCVCQMKFRNVCKVKKQLVQLYWSGAEHYRYCCQWMEKAIPSLCSHSGPTLQAILLQAVEKWTARWIVSQSVRNANKMCFYEIC